MTLLRRALIHQPEVKEMLYIAHVEKVHAFLQSHPPIQTPGLFLQWRTQSPRGIWLTCKGVLCGLLTGEQLQSSVKDR